MARKSRKQLPAGCVCTGDLGKPVSWRVALYARLSVEDTRKREQGTLENQLELLRRYAAEQQDWTVTQEYADGGYSGTHFMRPEFERLLSDLEAGRANCVVVKDLSRFGRNHIEMGYYLEQLFPQKGIRFVAIGEGYDSLFSRIGEDGIELPARNLINELYARDISRKVTARFAVQMQQGKFLGSFAAYGYRKAGADRYRLEVDEPAASAVRQMFAWRAAGVSLREIARRLTSGGILPPSAPRAKGKTVWHKSTVGRILQNPVYLGSMVQGKQRNIPRSTRRRTLPPEEWVVVEQTHPPLVSQALFAAVNKGEKKDGKTGSALLPHIAGGSAGR